ncbi:MAG: tRNA (adenosine(37)-N6)-dimethylallyltransferase MiaA [Zavarzinella sp.]
MVSGKVDIEIFRQCKILTGPTGSGKSGLALQIAPQLNAEIISADSMTVYRHMDIGTAKPTLAEREIVPHHLIDVLEPWESCNVAWWLQQAAITVQDIIARGKVPLIVGGTPFFLKALICGLFDAPPLDPAVRLQVETMLQERGAERLHDYLSEIDPITAQRLHPNDTRRITRAVEVFLQMGKPMSVLHQENWWAGNEPAFQENQCLCIDWPREELYQRINVRVEAMFASGWVAEVHQLEQLPHPISKEASRALGYPEIRDYLQGISTLVSTLELVKLRTRQFAKRQLTWFRNLQGVQFVPIAELADIW